jgi:cobalt-zinc-cadmium efflux system outer membrane protein
VDGDGLAAGVSLPLPIWNRRRGEQAAAEAERARAEAGRAATERRLGAEARNAIAELTAAIEIYRRLADGAAPAAREALEDLRAGYRAGRLSYVDLIEGQRAALESRMALVEASAEVWRVRGRIERLAGSVEEGGTIR